MGFGDTSWGNPVDVEATLLKRRGRLLFESELPEAPIGVRAVRHAALDTLPDHPNADMADLVISELATNAVAHAGCPCVLRLFGLNLCLLIQVQDSSNDLPVMGPPLENNLGGAGRGLQMVQAVSDSFGVETRQPRGKTVWATLCLCDKERL
jgi:anti-sigma regulatory factor (Ser/Thr protein kinase)